MRRFAASVIVATAAIALSGCAYKPLKAPCGPDEGHQALAFAPDPLAAVTPNPFRALDPCGPMKPI